MNLFHKSHKFVSIASCLYVCLFGEICISALSGRVFGFFCFVLFCCFLGEEVSYFLINGIFLNPKGKSRHSLVCFFFDQFTVTASDKGDPVLTSRAAPVTIIVTRNTAPPEWDQGQYTFSIQKDHTLNTNVGSARATDRDPANVSSFEVHCGLQGVLNKFYFYLRKKGKVVAFTFPYYTTHISPCSIFIFQLEKQWLRGTVHQDVNQIGCLMCVIISTNPSEIFQRWKLQSVKSTLADHEGKYWHFS